ncbi:Citrate transporter [Thermodesulfobacterium geofontis OPF15]|uniref:Citrate transporter n=1 Tax=Thermodesulfobacterium geofontis (strain OPF15) TaxID=795359 RepID=F8C4P4_THEGP|nr:ArsB/NhaD family transporter [Thermodesulfobacterium geofontis]AEH22714.1 Citrate transporter [Thermodesulfobacterium geofontis OPF15]
MKRLFIILFFLAFLSNIPILNILAFAEKPQKDLDIFYISGRILDPHKEPVKEAELRILIDRKPHKLIVEHKEVDKVLTSSHGTFQIEFHLPKGVIENTKIQLEIVKNSYKKTLVDLKKEDFAVKENQFYLKKDIMIERKFGSAFWIATLVFLITYTLISFEILHRTVAAMIGAATMLILTYTLGNFNPEFHIISFERAIEAIDMNVIFLLLGMMIIVGILKHTGIFQWCAYMSYKIAKGNVMALVIISCLFIAFTSAFLDNVTIMLLYTPVLIEIAIALKINPLSLLIPGIMASNAGGTATLIGDPPNIMIGSYAGLTFMQFVYALTPVIIICMIVLVVYNKFFYAKEYEKGKVEDIDSFINYLKEEYKIKDRSLLTYGLFVMVIVIAFFVTHGIWHMEVSIPALFGAGLLFTYSILTKKVNLLELIEKDIEWTTLLFFIFLFMLVGALEEVGLLAVIADWVYKLSAGNLTIAVCLILWVSAIMSAFVDNIPFTATMLPIVAYLTKVIPGAESNVLWWALALGACLGGNGTMIGASANVVTIGIAESLGYKISFLGFIKYAFIYMLITIIICNIWLLIFY